jgi:type IX secretion system PorP/SprF family membrane protein
MFNMMNINPAYAGIREVGNVNVLLRKQWDNLPGAPTSGSVSYDQRVKDKNVGFGAQVYYDRIGIEKTTGVQGYYSYSAPLKNATLNLGLSMGMLNYSVNYNHTNPFDQGDPGLQTRINGYLPTAGVGALLETERWYVGVSAPALLKTKLSADGQAVIKKAGAEGHYFITTGYLFSVSDEVVLKPSLLIKSVSGAPLQYDLNMNAWFGDIVCVGASYRTQDAVVDYTTSNLSNYNRGTHEFMFRYELGKQESKKIHSTRYY